MRGNLPKREPDTLQKWETEDLYEKMIAKNEGKPRYILHDGPPYANGEIHLGTALNKMLKDFIIKYKNMNGFCAPYVPGWDTHGLPIELKAMKSIGVENGAIPPRWQSVAICTRGGSRFTGVRTVTLHWQKLRSSTRTIRVIPSMSSSR